MKRLKKKNQLNSFDVNQKKMYMSARHVNNVKIHYKD